MLTSTAAKYFLNTQTIVVILSIQQYTVNLYFKFTYFLILNTTLLYVICCAWFL